MSTKRRVFAAPYKKKKTIRTMVLQNNGNNRPYNLKKHSKTIMPTTTTTTMLTIPEAMVSLCSIIILYIYVASRQ